MATDGESHDDPPVVPPLRGTAVRGAKLALVGWVSSQTITFVAYVVLARLVSPAEFGRFAAASIVTGVGGLFAESGMTAALINRRDRLEEAASTAFFSQLGGGVLLALAAAGLGPVVGIFFHSARIGALSAALAGMMLMRAIIVVPDAMLQRNFSFARRVAVDPLGALGFAGVATAACAAGAGAWGLVAGTYASMAMQVLSSWGFARTWPHRRLASMAVWRELVAFARPLLGSEILRRIAGQVDAVMLGRFSGAAALGQYRNGLRLAAQPTNAFLDVGAYVLLPTLARLSGHRERLRDAMSRVIGVTAAGALPVSVAMVPLGVPMAVLTFGARWRPAGHAIAGLSAVLIGAGVISISAELFKALGRPGLLVRVHGINVVVTTITVIAAAIPFGLLGVAIAVSASQLVAAVYAFDCVTKLIDVTWDELLVEFMRPALSATVMLGVMLAFAHLVHPLEHGEAGGLALTAAQVAIAALTYLAVLIMLDRRRRADLHRVLARVPGVRRALRPT